MIASSTAHLVGASRQVVDCQPACRQCAPRTSAPAFNVDMICVRPHTPISCAACPRVAPTQLEAYTARKLIARCKPSSRPGSVLAGFATALSDFPRLNELGIEDAEMGGARNGHARLHRLNQAASSFAPNRLSST